MKKLLSIIIALSMVLSLMPAFSVLSAGDVVYSESFESGFSSWTLKGEEYGDRISIATDEKTDGKSSIKFIDDVTDKTFSITSEPFPITAGRDYVLSADFYCPEGTAAKIYMQFLNEAGKSVLSQSILSSPRKWETLSKAYSAPENAVNAVILLWAQDSAQGVTYIDNIKVSEKGETFVDTYEVKTLKDGEIAFKLDFEEPLDNSWKFEAEKYRKNIFVSSEAHSVGNSSLAIYDDDANTIMGITSRKFGVEAGATYTVSVDFSIPEGGSGKVYFTVYDSANKKLYSKSAVGKGKEWQRNVSEHVTPEGAAYAVIILQGAAATIGKTFIDNVVVYKGRVAVDTKIENPLVKSFKTDYKNMEYSVPDIYDMPEFKPTIGHPRVYFNKNDIETIKKNATHPQNENAFKQLMKDVNNTSDGKLKDVANNVDSKMMGIIQSKAFYYAVWGDEKAGREAVAMLNNFLDTANPENSEYNAQGFMVFTIAAVYDWCYPLLTEVDKKYFQNMGCVAASTMEITFPPSIGNVINGHSAEAQLQRDQMAFGIAVYDERPEIYQNIAGRYFDEMVYSKQWLATAKASMFGDSYSTYRYQWEVIACYMMSALGIDKIYGEDHGKTLYWNLYARRGDGQLLRDGDSKGNHKQIDAYDTTGTRAYFLAGNYYKDPYLKGEFLRQNNGFKVGDVSSNQTLSAVEVLCFNDPSVEYKSVRELPLSMYYPSPKGDMIARTGWAEGKDSPVAIAEMSIDEYFTLAHDHLDSGEFEIYYKGSLATDTGYYQAGRNGSTTENKGNTVAGTVHFYNYQKRTIAHNCMLVYDPDEDPANFNNDVNDGGQISGKHFADGVTHVKDYLKKEDQYKHGTVMGREIGPDEIQPDYTYLKGDIENAYGEKVPEYERSFMFLNLKNNDYPMAMVVFDRVVAKDKSFKKSWVLHGVNKPEVSGNRTVFRRAEEGYNGKLTVDTLLPKADNTSINVIGGKGQEHMVNGVNYYGETIEGTISEGGGYRIEVSPKAQSEKDYFLNVLQVGDNDKELAPLESQMIEGNTHTGVQIYDRVVMFGKEKERTSNTVSFSFTGEGSFKFAVADLKEGTWSVSKDGTELSKIAVAKEGGVGSFEGVAGSYTLTYVSADGEKVFTKTPLETMGINLKKGTTYIYSDVEPTIINSRTLVPMRAIFEALDASVSWDAETSTATGEKDGRIIKIIKDSTIAYVDDKEITLDSPATIVNGRFLVPVRFIAESFGIEVNWDALSKTVIFKDAALDGLDTFKGPFVPRFNVENSLTVEILQQSGDDGAGNNIRQILDGNYASSWGSKVDDEGNLGFGIFDLGSVKTIDSLYMAFKAGKQRIYTFSIYVSEDGKNYTLAKDKLKSSGTSEELEKFDLGGVKGRYIKILGYGNTVNDWNNYTEIFFTGKQGRRKMFLGACKENKNK